MTDNQEAVQLFLDAGVPLQVACCCICPNQLAIPGVTECMQCRHAQHTECRLRRAVWVADADLMSLLPPEREKAMPVSQFAVQLSEWAAKCSRSLDVVQALLQSNYVAFGSQDSSEVLCAAMFKVINGDFGYWSESSDQYLADVLRLLTDAGTDLTARIEQGCTPLFCAVHSRVTSAIRVLLAADPTGASFVGIPQHVNPGDPAAWEQGQGNLATAALRHDS